MRGLRLEVFADPAAAVAGTVVTSSDALEEARLAAYEQGYAAGWDDAVAAQDAEDVRLRAEASRALQGLAFSYEEARSHVLRGLEPLLREVVQRVLPPVARAALPALVADALRPLAAAAADLPVDVVLNPATRAQVEPVLAEAPPFPIRFIDEPALAEGLVQLRAGDAEARVDIDRALAEIEAATVAFFRTQTPLEKDRRNG